MLNISVVEKPGLPVLLERVVIPWPPVRDQPLPYEDSLCRYVLRQLVLGCPKRVLAGKSISPDLTVEFSARRLQYFDLAFLREKHTFWSGELRVAVRGASARIPPVANTVLVPNLSRYDDFKKHRRAEVEEGFEKLLVDLAASELCKPLVDWINSDQFSDGP